MQLLCCFRKHFSHKNDPGLIPPQVSYGWWFDIQIELRPESISCTQVCHSSFAETSSIHDFTKWFFLKPSHFKKWNSMTIRMMSNSAFSEGTKLRQVYLSRLRQIPFNHKMLICFPQQCFLSRKSNNFFYLSNKLSCASSSFSFLKIKWCIFFKRWIFTDNHKKQKRYNTVHCQTPSSTHCLHALKNKIRWRLWTQHLRGNKCSNCWLLFQPGALIFFQLYLNAQLQPEPALPLGELGGCLGRWAKGGAKKEPKNMTTWFRKWRTYTKKRTWWMWNENPPSWTWWMWMKLTFTQFMRR